MENNAQKYTDQQLQAMDCFTLGAKQLVDTINLFENATRLHESGINESYPPRGWLFESINNYARAYGLLKSYDVPVKDAMEKAGVV